MTAEPGRRLVISVDAKFLDGPKVHAARVSAIREAVAQAFTSAVSRELPGAKVSLTVSAEWQYLLFSSATTSTTATDTED